MTIINGIEMDDGVDEPNETPVCKSCKQRLDDDSIAAGEHSLCNEILMLGRNESALRAAMETLKLARHQLLTRNGLCKDTDNRVALEINKTLAHLANVEAREVSARRHNSYSNDSKP